MYLEHDSDSQDTSGDGDLDQSGYLNKAFNHPKGFNGENSNIKVGSLQRYIQKSKSCALVEKEGIWHFPVEEVHKIAVLDLRVGNANRHAANIPIDHGYCLPESFEDFKFVWLEWPQARQQFSVETLDYIKSLDAEKDIKILESNGLKFSKLSLRNLRILTKLLKRGAKRKLSPYQIGGILCRDSHGNSSVIEKVIAETQKVMFPEANEAWFLRYVADLLAVELDKVAMIPLQLKDLPLS